MTPRASALLIHEPPLQVLPSLAIAVGLQRAIILQQVHYWIGQLRPEPREGRQWIFNSYEDWQKNFPFWSISTIRRHIRELEADGLLLSAQFDLPTGDAEKYYTIDYDALNTLMGHPPSVQNEQMPSAQIEHTHLLNLNTSIGSKWPHHEEEETKEENREEREEAALSPVDRLSNLLCSLYGISDSAGWQLKDQYAKVAVELAGLGATVEQVRAFWAARDRKKPAVNYFVSDFVTWRAGQNGSNGHHVVAAQCQCFGTGEILTYNAQRQPTGRKPCPSCK